METTATTADRAQAFTRFVKGVEPRLSYAFAAAYGPEVGADVTSDALAWAWEHWERVQRMENPAGYLYAVGRNNQRRRHRRRKPVLMNVDPERTPWVEPELPAALAALPDQQRVVVVLLHCFEWTMCEVAELLDVSKSTVQSHAERGLARLRSRLGVTL